MLIERRQCRARRAHRQARTGAWRSTIELGGRRACHEIRGSLPAAAAPREAAPDPGVQAVARRNADPDAGPKTLDQLRTAAADGEVDRLSAALAPIGIELGVTRPRQSRKAVRSSRRRASFRRADRACRPHARGDRGDAALRRSAAAWRSGQRRPSFQPLRLPPGSVPASPRLSCRSRFRGQSRASTCAPPRRAPSCRPAGAAVTARWWRSATPAGVTTRYGHLSRFLVSPGDVVGTGEHRSGASAPPAARPARISITRPGGRRARQSGDLPCRRTRATRLAVVTHRWAKARNPPCPRGGCSGGHRYALPP